jgi:hypothetical protein
MGYPGSGLVEGVSEAWYPGFFAESVRPVSLHRARLSRRWFA